MHDAGRHDQDRVPSTTPGQLLGLIRSRPAWTRQELLEATGMSRPTLLARLSPLLREGLVHEFGSAASTGGRPASLIRFDDRHMAILTVDLGHSHGTVGIADVNGRQLRSAQSEIDVFRDDPAQVLDPLLDQGRALLGADPRARLIGIGLGLPAPIWPSTGLPHPIWTMPAWRDFPVRERIGEIWNVPIVLENDARAMALGEASVDDAKTVLAVKWAHGIGAGVVADGECLAGEEGAAGDIGHIKVSSGNRRCRCGRRGCLAAYASGYALTHTLRLPSVEDLIVRALMAEDRVLRALTDAADAVSTVLASLIAMLNPGALILSGPIGRIPHVVAEVGQTLRAIALSRSTANLRVLSGRLGDHAACVGLARLVAARVLRPEAVDRQLSETRSVTASGVYLGEESLARHSRR